MYEHQLIELYITLDDAQVSTTLEQQLASIDLDGMIVQTLAAVGITHPVMVTLLITDDAGIREMNKQYREQDKATDVLSFPLLEQPLVQAPAELLWPPREVEQDGRPTFVTPPDATLNLGDIVMSWPTLQRQAAEAGHDAVAELLYLLVHGVLHLVGFDDHTEAGYTTMVQIQCTILSENGYKV